MKKLRWAAVVCVITVFAFLFCLASTSDAAAVYFTDRGAFNLAAGGGLSFESFETKLVAAPQPTYTFAGFTVSETGGINAITDVLSNSSFGNNPVTDGINAIWYDDNGDSIGTFFSFTNPTNAFGLDITTFFDTTITIGGDVNTSLTFVANTPRFFGVIDVGSPGFSSISFDASGGSSFTMVGFDAVSYGSATSVPEPSTLLLLGSGLLGLLSYGRKRMNK